MCCGKGLTNAEQPNITKLLSEVINILEISKKCRNKSSKDKNGC